MPHISDAKLTSHGKNARPHDQIYLESVSVHAFEFSLAENLSAQHMS